MSRPICYCIEDDCPNEHPPYEKCFDCGSEAELEDYRTTDQHGRPTILRLCHPCTQIHMRQDTDDPMGMENQARIEMDAEI